MNNTLVNYQDLSSYVDKYFSLTQHFPIEMFESRINIPRPAEPVRKLIDSLLIEYIGKEENKFSIIMCGIDIYNFYIRESNIPQAKNLICATPYLEWISIKYQDDVEKIYEFLKDKVPDKKLLTFNEYYPFYRYLGTRTEFLYNGVPVINVYHHYNSCIPYSMTSTGCQIVTSSYLLSYLFVSKFKIFVEQKNAKDKNDNSHKQWYFNFGFLISNLVFVRNQYLKQHNYTVLNDNNLFRELKINCVGSTITLDRISRLRIIKCKKNKKAPFTIYRKGIKGFNPDKSTFANTSGNLIRDPSYAKFTYLKFKGKKDKQKISSDDKELDEVLGYHDFDEESDEASEEESK
jgi:hypothetical protein